MVAGGVMVSDNIGRLMIKMVFVMVGVWCVVDDQHQRFCKFK